MIGLTRIKSDRSGLEAVIGLLECHSNKDEADAISAPNHRLSTMPTKPSSISSQPNKQPYHGSQLHS